MQENNLKELKFNKYKKVFASLMMFLSSVIWGFAYSVQNISAQNLGNFSVTFFKGAGGFLLLLTCLLLNKKFNKDTIVGGILIGLSSFAGCILQQISMQYTSISNISFITALYIIFVPILGIFFKRKPSKYIFPAIVVALVGIYLLCIKDGLVLNYGDAYTLIGSIAFGYQIILIDYYIQKCDAMSLVSVQQMTIAVLCFIVMIIFEKPSINDFKASFVPILYMVFLSGIVATLIQNRFQRDLDASLASLIMSLESVFGAIGGWLLLGQTLTIREVIGCVLIFIAILIAEK